MHHCGGMRHCFKGVYWYDGIESESFTLESAMSLYTDISHHYSAVASLTNQLATVLRQLSPVQCVAFTWPSFYDDQSRMMDVTDITVNEVSGFPALSIASGAYAKLTADKGEPTRVPPRVPGVICLPCKHETSVTQLVDNINIHKQIIKSLLTDKEIGITAVQRHDLLHSVAPRCITLSLYRSLTYFSEPVRRVGFTWALKNSQKKYSKDDFLDYLKGSRENPPAGIVRAQWYPFVDDEIEKVLTSKANTFYIKRPLPPVAMANISFHGERKTEMRHAHTPFLVFTDDPVKVSPLKSFIKSGEQCERDYLVQRLYAMEAV